MIGIGLIGYGCVAQGFVQILMETESNVEIRKICIKNPAKRRNLPTDLFTTSINELVNDPQVGIVVELIDDADSALEALRLAAALGKPFITANKKMVAENLSEINRLKTQNAMAVRYEGAVAGSIPILQNLENYYQSQPISSIRAILNGSTNYILTEMKRKGLGYQAALEKAQHLGFAESDPLLDVSGMDSAYKTVILAFEAFNHFLSLSEISIRGIDKLTLQELTSIENEDGKVKLIAEIQNQNGHLTAAIAPQIVSREDPLYNVDHEFNAIAIESKWVGNQLLIGKGAGCLPTGMAVYSDLKQILAQFEPKVLNPIAPY